MALGRPFNTTTPLGQLMWQRGYTVRAVEQATGISHRVLSDYLASRKPISSKHLAELTAEFNVPRDVLLGTQPVGATPANLQVADKVNVGKLIQGWRKTVAS